MFSESFKSLPYAFCLHVASVLFYHKGLIDGVFMVDLTAGSPFSEKDFCYSVRAVIGFLVTCLTKALLGRLLSLAGQPEYWWLQTSFISQ